MTKRTIAKIPISPGTPARVEDFRYVDQGLEWNMQNEYDLRDDHLQASRVINWEIFGELALGLDGWTPGESLKLTVAANELFVTEGLAYIGGRSYVLSDDAELFDGETPANNTYNIYLKYTLASDEFAYEYTTSNLDDTHLIKYLLLGTCQYTGGTGWIDPPVDKRASNTALGAPATVSGSDSGPIFTVENTGSGLGLLVRLSDAQIGEDGTPQILTIWGTSTTGLTLKESGTANTIVLSCDAAGRMKVAGDVNVTGTITNGTWQGTAIANAYVAGLDQNLLQASSPTFVGLTLSGPIATPTTITTSGDITCGGTLTADGMFPEADKADVIGSETLTWQDIFVVNLKDDDGVIFAKSTSDGKFNLNAGTGINDIDTAMAGSPTDDQLLTAAGIKTYVEAEIASASYDADLAIGSANATWINCPLEMWRNAGQNIDYFIMTANGRVTTNDTNAAYVFYSVPLPTNRGGKKLYINGTRVSLSKADSSDYVTVTTLRGYTDTGYTAMDNDTTDKNAIDLWEDVSMGALDSSIYHAVKVQLEVTTTTAGDLEIQFVTVRYYYA